MKRRTYLHLALLSSLFWACTNQESKPKEGEQKKVENVKEEISPVEQRTILAVEKDGLTLYPVPIEVDYQSAALSLSAPRETEELKEGSTTFKFEVNEYELREQTAAEKAKQIANSEKGQHIHFIVNNAPYQAKYDPEFEAQLLEGNNVVLAFLSKSFHESVKVKEAAYFHNFYVGEGESDFDEQGAHLFYSRPKGNYKAAKAKQLLVDFYLMNTSLSEEGNKVKLSIDDTEFILSSWQAYFVEGLSVGEHRFRIQLIDQDGKLIEGPFNDSGVRKITIEA